MRGHNTGNMRCPSAAQLTALMTRKLLCYKGCEIYVHDYITPIANVPVSEMLGPEGA